jgi:hypothetical protein
MNRSLQVRGARTIRLSMVALVVGAGAGAHAQVVTLSDHNSVALLDPHSQAGMFNWSVDGVNQLFQQWFWYRVGATGLAHSIDTISTPTVATFGTRQVFTSYTSSTFSVEVDYLLTGSTAGSGHADMGETIKITNLSGQPLDYHFFQYSDFDLGGTPGGQTVTLGKDLNNLFNEALQTGPAGTLDETTTVATPGANHGEAAFFASTRTNLNTVASYTLNDVAGPVGPGDATWAFEWDLLIPAGGDVLISKDKLINVPGPGAASLLGLGLAGLARRRRRAV